MALEWRTRGIPFRRAARRVGDARTFLAACLVGLVGCVGCHRNVLDAGSLPPAMCANPSISVQGLDLSRLARPQPSGKLIQPGDQLEMSVVSGADDESGAPFRLRCAIAQNYSLPGLPFETHRSGWYPWEFGRRYKVHRTQLYPGTLSRHLRMPRLWQILVVIGPNAPA